VTAAFRGNGRFDGLLECAQGPGCDGSCPLRLLQPFSGVGELVVDVGVDFGDREVSISVPTDEIEEVPAWGADRPSQEPIEPEGFWSIRIGGRASLEVCEVGVDHSVRS